MIHIGEYNTLTILRDTEPGLFLGDAEENDVLLPNRYVPETFEIADLGQECCMVGICIIGIHENEASSTYKSEALFFNLMLTEL